MLWEFILVSFGVITCLRVIIYSFKEEEEEEEEEAVIERKAGFTVQTSVMGSREMDDHSCVAQMSFFEMSDKIVFFKSGGDMTKRRHLFTHKITPVTNISRSVCWSSSC